MTEATVKISKELVGNIFYTIFCIWGSSATDECGTCKLKKKLLQVKIWHSKNYNKILGRFINIDGMWIHHTTIVWLNRSTEMKNVLPCPGSSLRK